MSDHAERLAKTAKLALRPPSATLADHTDTDQEVAADSRFSHDFGRISVRSRQEPAAQRIVHDVLESPGEEMPASTRTGFERMFRADFGHVRIHTDRLAQRSAEAVGARAYTVASHVVFAPGAYSPNASSGRRLIAHELTHVVQQGSSVLPSHGDTLRIDDSDEAPAKRAADGAGHMPAQRSGPDGKGRRLQRNGSDVVPWFGTAARTAQAVSRGVMAGGTAIAGAGAFAATFLWAKDADLKPDEERRLLEEDRENALLRIGDAIRGNTRELARHLARILGSDVAGMPPDHQEDPERDRPHWWKEVLNFIKEVAKHALKPKQLGRELSKEFTKEQIQEIIAALKRAAEFLGKDPPDFPPAAYP